MYYFTEENIFIILTSKENDWQQVEILRLIAKTMADEKIRNALLKASDTQEIWNILEQQCIAHCILKKA